MWYILSVSKFCPCIEPADRCVGGGFVIRTYVKGRIKMAREKTDSMNVKQAAADKKPVK